MNRATVIILFLLAGLASCKKDLLGSVEGYKAQAHKDDKIIADYLAANPSLVATKIDTSGVYYIIEQPGTGNDLFTNSTQVTVGYTGKLLSTQQIFTQTNNFHPTFVLSQVIKGWQLGLPFGKKGGIIRLLIPSRYAYGPSPQPLVGREFGLKGGLPANAVLDFEITLYDIIN
ncbi:FKBP-type peptidyl-prolyl cis-trans isomerase [Mucilaginibacter panaciglaebae]|uniref:Peptidyl-prolyl cis-trans isomerase n=1 Tax=Mucilaginibacter panaciglaebae TaxID=502331 RepID=A0ABP7WNW6_9SPHI